MGRMNTAPARVLLATVLCCGVIAGAVAQNIDTLKVNVNVVNVSFSVTDRNGRFIAGLTANDFRVDEDGRRQDIQHFSRENELPVTLALAIDTSPSVRPVFAEEKTTAQAFLESVVGAHDLAMVVGFDRHVTLVQDFTDNVKFLKRAVDSLEVAPEPGVRAEDVCDTCGTSLYDAVYLASHELDDEAGRKAIILISDGEDTTSRVKYNEALLAVHRSDTIIYAISNSFRGGFPYVRRARYNSGGDIGTLRKFSSETGGATFVLDDQNTFQKIFDQITQELRSQYTLGYSSTNTARDGKFRQIKITPRNSSYTVRARKGYYGAKGDIR